jgi:hypothetical protein
MLDHLNNLALQWRLYMFSFHFDKLSRAILYQTLLLYFWKGHIYMRSKMTAIP